MIDSIWAAVVFTACFISFLVGLQFGKAISISAAYSRGYTDGKNGTYDGT